MNVECLEGVYKSSARNMDVIAQGSEGTTAKEKLLICGSVPETIVAFPPVGRTVLRTVRNGPVMFQLEPGTAWHD